MTREELEKIYNEPKTTLTREKLNEIYSPAKTVKTSGTKATLSSHDLMERQKRNARVNQYKAEKEARNEANKIKSQQITDKLMGIETAEVGAEKYNSAPINTVDVKSLSKTAENPVDKWLDSSYKLSKDEKKEAKDISEAYMKEIRNKRGNLSDEEMQKYNQMAKLYTKSHVGSSIMAGIADAIPFYDTAMNAAYKTLGYGDDFSEQWEDTKENARKQNPIAYTGANIGMNLAKYGTGTELLKGAGLLGESGKITKGVSKAIKNPKVAGSVANILGDTSLDIALDTIPQLAKDISKGDEKAGANALKNVGTNLAFNTLGEGVGIVGGKVIGKLADKKQLGKAESLSPLEEHIKKADEIVKESDDLQKQMLESSKELTEKISDNNFIESTKRIPTKVGKNTFIYDSYNGNVPKQNIEEFSRIDISNDAYAKAKDNISLAEKSSQETGKSKKTLLTKIYEGIFKDGETQISVPVKNTYFDDKDYIVAVNKNAIGKIMSDKDNTPERIAILESLSDVIGNGKYVGSGNYSNYKGKEIPKKVVRYDYFETDVKINGEDYVVSYSVEVIPGKNNYRTHKIINEINLTKDVPSGETGNLPAAQGNSSSLFNNIITNSPQNVNGITDYRKQNIPNHDEMNKNIDKFIGMYGDDAAKSKALEFKQSINKFIEENSEEAWEDVARNANELDRMLQGKTYTYKNQGKAKNKSNVRQAKYDKEIRDILTYETDNLIKEAEENALKNGKVSKARSNTLENSDINTADELKSQYLNEDNFKYQEISEKQSMEEATTRVGLNQEHWKNKLMAQDSLSGTDVDTMMLIYTDAVQKARQSGDDELWKEAGAIFKKIQEAGTKGGQLVQSFAKWSRNTPEGIVAESFRKAKEQTSNIIGDKKAQKLIDDLYEDVQKEIYTLANVAYSSGMNSRDAQIAFAQIGKIINANTPKTVSGAVKTYLMDSMLLNFRTLISRNAGGNLGYNAMEFARQPITAAVDKGVSAITGKRTRTGWNADKISGALEGLAKGIADEVDDIRKGVHTAKSGENTVKNAIQLNAHALKGNNPVSNAINKIDDLTKHMLSIGDRPFYEAAYKQRMAELSDLKNKGLLGADIAKMSDAEFNAYAELSAKMDGLTATYQDKGDMAKAFGDLKKAIGQYSKGAVGFDALSQLTMPFTNTPGNIITRSLEYSPLGAIKNTANTINEVRKGDFNQQRFVDELGRNILGTGLFAGGIAAYDKGLMTGSYSDDKDMKNAQKNSGMQEYAMRTNIDGKEGNFDISWIPVLGNNMIMAAATKEAYDEGENTADAINKAASASANALLNTSTLQGLNRVFGGNASYNTENNLFENAKDALTSGFGQAVPSTLRQIAQSKDTYERNLNDGDRPYWQNSMINSVPGLRETLLQPKVDNEGNLILQNQGRDLGSRVVENMISPGKYTEITHSPVNEESMRLFESTGNNYSFLPTASRSDITNDDFEPTDAQYREYQQKLGRYNSELAGALIDSSFYQALPDSEKESALQEVYKGMKAVAKMEMLPGYTSDDKIADEYKKGGVRSALAYIEKKKAFADAGINMSGKKAQEAYASGGVNGLQEYADYNKAVKSLGLSVNDKTQTLYDAGGIPYLKQYSTYKTKADKDGNGRLKKEEVASYLNASGLSQEEKRYWFSVLYTGTSKNPY